MHANETAMNIMRGSTEDPSWGSRGEPERFDSYLEELEVYPGAGVHNILFMIISKFAFIAAFLGGTTLNGWLIYNIFKNKRADSVVYSMYINMAFADIIVCYYDSLYLRISIQIYR